MPVVSYLKPMTGTTLDDRSLLRISGEESRPFLQGLVTQDVLTLTADAPRWGGLLSPQGKVLFDFLLWAPPEPEKSEDILIDCEATQIDALARRLTLYRLRRQVTIARDDGLQVHWALDSANGASGKPLDPRLSALGHRWISREVDGEVSSQWRMHRLSLGVCEGVAELGSDQTLWLEANAGELNGVDFRKGCYIGQENTARMHYRAKVNRRLVVVPLAQADNSRQRLALPDLGVSIEHRRVEDLAGLALPEWLASAIAGLVDT